MNKNKLILSMIAALLSFSLLIHPSSAALGVEFKDISEDSWESRYVVEMFDRGLMFGTSSNTFEPDSEININTVCTVLHRLAGCPNLSYFNNDDTKGILENFNQIHYDYPSWSKGAIMWASLNGIVMLYRDLFTLGYTEAGIYRYVEQFKRECAENADTLYKYYVAYSAPFPQNLSFSRGDIVMTLYFYSEHMDFDVSARGDISVFKDSATVNNSKSGVYHDKYYPLSGDSALRSKYYMKMSEYWSWAVGCGIVNGYPDGTLSQSKPITRAEFAAMISRYIEYYKIG